LDQSGGRRPDHNGAVPSQRKSAEAVASGRNVNPKEILLWPDGFWCFREEFSQGFLRDGGYRAIPHGSDESLTYARPRI
jgi:hypothetical protein